MQKACQQILYGFYYLFLRYKEGGQNGANTQYFEFFF